MSLSSSLAKLRLLLRNLIQPSFPRSESHRQLSGNRSENVLRLLNQIFDDLFGKNSTCLAWETWQCQQFSFNLPPWPRCSNKLPRGRTQSKTSPLNIKGATNILSLSSCPLQITIEEFYKKYPRISASISINKYLYGISSGCLFSKFL